MPLLRPHPTALALAWFKRGVSQDELAARAEVAPSTIQRLEAGELPRFRTALKIAAALEADAGELFLAHQEERREQLRHRLADGASRWERRGRTGRIKATRPGFGGNLGWNFFTVPAGWEDAQ